MEGDSYEEIRKAVAGTYDKYAALAINTIASIRYPKEPNKAKRFENDYKENCIEKILLTFDEGLLDILQENLSENYKLYVPRSRIAEECTKQYLKNLQGNKHEPYHETMKKAREVIVDEWRKKEEERKRKTLNDLLREADILLRKMRSTAYTHQKA